MVGFQGGSRGLIPDRKVLLGMTRLQNTLELSWLMSSHYVLRLLPGIQFPQDPLPYHRWPRLPGHTSITNCSLHNMLSHSMSALLLIIPALGRKRQDGPRGLLARGLLSELQTSEESCLKSSGGEPVRTRCVNSRGREN